MGDGGGIGENLYTILSILLWTQNCSKKKKKKKNTVFCFKKTERIQEGLHRQVLCNHACPSHLSRHAHSHSYYFMETSYNVSPCKHNQIQICIIFFTQNAACFIHCAVCFFFVKHMLTMSLYQHRVLILPFASGRPALWMCHDMFSPLIDSLAVSSLLWPQQCFIDQPWL